MDGAVSLRAGPELAQLWRQQLACQRQRREARGPRPWAVISYLTRGRVYDGLIDVRRIVYLVQRDERRHDHSLATKLFGYAPSAVPWGIKIGGIEGCRFEKDLALAPRLHARGPRFDLAAGELLSLALALDRYLERQVRFPHRPRCQRPNWPRFWAAFDPQDAQHIRCGGPEFEAAWPNESGTPVLAFQRTVAGLTLFPLEYVGHVWRQLRMVLADLKALPKRQIIALNDPARNLCGFSAAIEYDLFHSRFSPNGSVALS